MTPAVEIDRLGYVFAGRQAPSLDDVSCVLAPGGFTLLVGETGSGKSTLLRALAGLVPHHAFGTMTGDVRLFGRNTREFPPAKLAGDVGLVLQSPDEQLCAADVEAEIAFGLENLCLPVDEIARRIDEQLARFRLREVRHARTHQLSGGQKQRLALAAVMAMRPRLLLLDEPLAQLDPQAADEFLHHLRALHAEGLTVVMAEHRWHDVLPLGDRVLAMQAGRLVADIPANESRLGAALGELGFEVAGPQLMPRGGEIRPQGAAPVLQVRDVSFRFPDRSDFSLKNVSFDLHVGQCTVLVGGNGSGKSTLLSLLAGLLDATAGEIDIRAGACGLVMQNPDLMLFNSTVHDELAFGPRQQRLSPEQIEGRAASAAAAFSLEELLGELPLALSQGQRLRTATAAVWSMAPAVLLLDEPTTGQDPGQAVRLLQAATGSLGASTDGVQCLLFSTHDARMAARFADRVLVLQAGELAADCSPAQFFGDESLLAIAGWRKRSP